MISGIVLGVSTVVALAMMRVVIKRDERWRAEQAALDEQARHRDHGEKCLRCGGRIEYIEYSAGNGDVLDAWWAHEKHPEDGHDAEPRIRP